MATKGIPDEQSRMATILTVPYMNCLAKIPFYTLLVNVFFAPYKSWAMLFLSTVTIFVALLVARLLTATVLKSMETAPFVMELPKYHPPTIFGVGQRAVERTWQYIKKVGTIVVAVSVCVFTLLQFPGVDKAKQAEFQSQMDKAVASFQKKIGKTSYASMFQEESDILKLVNIYNDFKNARLNAKGADASRALNQSYQSKHPDLYKFLKPKGDKDAKTVSKSLRGLVSKRKSLRRQIKEEQIENSFMGMIGRSLEPVTHWAGFNWKINVAILSSFAARESSVATIGVLYQQGADENKNSGRTDGHRGRAQRVNPPARAGHHGLFCSVSTLPGHLHYDQGPDRILQMDALFHPFSHGSWIPGGLTDLHGRHRPSSQRHSDDGNLLRSSGAAGHRYGTVQILAAPPGSPSRSEAG